MDRREFVLSLSVAAASVTLFGACRRIDPSGLEPALLGALGDEEAWGQLGAFWLQRSGQPQSQVLVNLAERLGWRPATTPEELVASILNAMREDFETHRVDGPDDWGLAETELAIYAVLSRDAQDSESDSETG